MGISEILNNMVNRIPEGSPGDPLPGGRGYMCLQTTRMSADPT